MRLLDTPGACAAIIVIAALADAQITIPIAHTRGGIHVIAGQRRAAGLDPIAAPPQQKVIVIVLFF